MFVGMLVLNFGGGEFGLCAQSSEIFFYVHNKQTFCGELMKGSLVVEVNYE